MTRLKLIGMGTLALTLSATATVAKQPVTTPVATHTPGAMARAALAAKTAMQRKMAASATHAPAPQSTTTPSTPAGAKPGNLGPGEHSAISIACSQKADAQGLHGQARQAFRSKCKHGG